MDCSGPRPSLGQCQPSALNTTFGVMATTRTRSNSEDRMEGQEAEPVTPLTDSGRTSPASCAPETQNDATSSRNRKKKKKKKVKKPEHPSEASTSQTTSVLRISRNKHWKYISSYNVGRHVFWFKPYLTEL